MHKSVSVDVDKFGNSSPLFRYEATSHMWFVLDYCVRDCKLPEDSAYGRAYDVVVTLL
ncbi:hypothetical protein F2Q70_00034538 [Brassica cretica]|uniref:Uncharacterized protein n=1 Tax=Brassica cretica TaxID=69181 RepID=A0A8S9JP43_BRACR|nr:hypothetical protein F2Q70_00034538 [Brassica cretica]